MNQVHAFQKGLIINMKEGVILGKDIIKKITIISDMPGCFEDEKKQSGIDQKTIVYKVEMHQAVENGTRGGLFFGFSHVYPGLVGDEYFMTKGHVHQKKTHAEYYWCTAGRGVLLLMNKNRNCRLEELEPGSLHYINGSFAHRLINTGTEKLIVGACWPSDAGYDYASVLQNGFSVRLKKVNGTPKLVSSI